MATDPHYVDPIFAYGHSGSDPATTGCSITGGIFYNPTTLQFPSGYVGDYFFADFCGGWIRSLDPSGQVLKFLYFPQLQYKYSLSLDKQTVACYGYPMSGESDKTWESRILHRHAGVREAVLESENFHAWKDQLPSVVVDGVRYYVRGGDMLVDEDQLIFEWALRTKLLPEEYTGSDSSE